MGNSLVLILQAEVMESNCDILNALRRAHLIASKLNLKEFDGWIQSELNGYPPNDVAEIPDYRTVKGSLKAFNPYRGWISAQLNDGEIERMICEQKLWQSIGELQELYNESIETNFLIEFPAERMQLIASLFRTPVPMRYAFSYTLKFSSRTLNFLKVVSCILICF